MPARILVVDDDAQLRDLLRRYLASWGFEVFVLPDACSLERRLQRERPDLVVLDRLMPGVDGLAALRTLRASGDDIPVVMLSARADEDDQIAGLDLGADDYLGKPFNPRELVARVQSVLRRPRVPHTSCAPEQRPPFRFGRFILDFQARTLSTAGKAFTLSNGEFALLLIFVSSPLRTLTRRRLLQSLDGPECDTTDRRIHVMVGRLRQILEAKPSAPRFIQTVRGRGYIFVPSGEDHMLS
ncbi:response regulator [Paraburkholderia terrae]|uniref:response regulator n=1 Tax=Paraburkholderia terrae TaxID=311230 RepID=UPI00296B3001|nr:response regulator [Paraburkholderia terrae]MDW3661909.1 response regulator [Paraburkholderia terrae]